MKKRGGYPGNLTREVKVRISPELYREIDSLSEERQFAIAYVVRGWIQQALKSHQSQCTSTGPEEKSRTADPCI
jgi:hypothetical protein